MEAPSVLTQMKRKAGRLRSLVGVPFVAGIVLAILAPFATSDLPLSTRLIYWVGLCLAGGIGVAFTDWLSQKFNLSLQPWQDVLIGSLGATTCVCLFMILLFPPRTLEGLLITIFYVWIIAVVLCFIGTLLRLTRTRGQAETNVESPALMDRLPLKFREAQFYAASSEDHYTRIYTSSGDHLLLMRLGDVPDLAQPTEGLTPHRSWWVAKEGVADVIKQDGKLVIRLKNEMDVPVSRAGAKRVKDAGWLP